MYKMFSLMVRKTSVDNLLSKLNKFMVLYSIFKIIESTSNCWLRSAQYNRLISNMSHA